MKHYYWVHWECQSHNEVWVELLKMTEGLWDGAGNTSSGRSFQIRDAASGESPTACILTLSELIMMIMDDNVVVNYVAELYLWITFIMS